MNTAAKKAGFLAGRLDRITDHVQRNYIEPEKIAGCQVLVARGGEVAYRRSFGLADRARAKPMADDTIFRIYSMTKPITSVALMTLYEQGHFQLNDSVYRLLPDWRNQRVWVSGEGSDMVTVPPRRGVTFRDLLCHTSGLTYGSALVSLGSAATGHPVDDVYAKLRVAREREETLRDFVNKLGQVPLRYEPGERWMYSYATDVCGALVELISGKRFDHYLQENILGPLGMKDTAFYVPADKHSRLAALYRRGPDKKLQLADDPETSPYRTEPKFFAGGSGLASTLSDYHRFCEMLRRGGELDGARILGPRTLELMHMNHLPGGKDLTQLAIGSFSETANEGVGFGLGFASTLGQVATGALSSGDYYWGGAASTIFWVDPKADLVVIFLTQLLPSNTFDFRGQLKSIVYSALAD
jgi:CubicO group peptidase (beta-lactamase class C family)